MPQLGAGQFPAGTGPGGFAPQNAPAPGQIRLPPRAVNYDPQIRDFTTTNGLYDAIHPVDQQVILALTIPLGSLKSAPTVGNTYHQVNRLSGITLVNEAEDRTKLALKRLLNAQKIEIIRIDVDVRVRGQFKVAVSYINLLTKKIVKRTVQP